MNQAAIKQCDNKSVGVLITNQKGEVALLKRAYFPVGIAPPAGHVDAFPSPVVAGVTEVKEEVGLTIPEDKLWITAINGRRVDNACRRTGGDHHVWWVFETSEFEGEITPDPDETQGAGWYTQAQIRALSERTNSFQKGEVSQAEWEANPGLEPVWVDFLAELGYGHDI